MLRTDDVNLSSSVITNKESYFRRARVSTSNNLMYRHPQDEATTKGCASVPTGSVI